jgi:glycosyltransferase involved in cell wall biosynthesis
MKHSISAVVICKNEERNISRCIRSLQSVSDDIIIVDSFSSDRTVKLARKLTSNVVQMNWNGYARQKNIGNGYAKHDYILSLDADELLSPELCESINREMLNPKHDAYEFSFLNWFGDRPIRHGGWKNNHHVRLFRRSNIRWNEFLVHERLMLDKTPVKRLAGLVHHYTAPNRKYYRTKMDRYASEFAQGRVLASRYASFWKKYTSTGFRFLKEYIFQFGFLDGKAGFIIAVEEARYTFLKYKLCEKKQSQIQ